MKALSRHGTLRQIARNHTWNYVLTSETDKAHAYQLDQRGELTRKTATRVRSGLRGADRLASAFGITLKGFLVLLELYPDDEATKRLKHDLFNNIFLSETQALANSLLTTRRGRHY